LATDGAITGAAGDAGTAIDGGDAAGAITDGGDGAADSATVAAAGLDSPAD